MKKLAIILFAIGFLSAVASGTARAQLYNHGPAWAFHEYVGAGGDVKVWGTVNCTPIAELAHTDPLPYCHFMGGFIPPWCNDILLLNWWKYSPCQNHDYFKAAVPYWDVDQWKLYDLRPWLLPLIPSPGDTLPSLPSVGDPTGVAQYVYTVVRVDQWLANPQPLQDQYTITNGLCPQLPGYLIGTTPIVFSPTGAEPFSTTPFTGTLSRDGDLTFKNFPVQPALSGWGVIALVLALAGVAVILVLRHRARVLA